MWWYVEPVERSRTSYAVLVRSVTNDNTVEELAVSVFFANKGTYIEVW